MDREKQIAEMAVDINDCITEFVTDVGDVYIDDEATAQKMFDKGYRKQSEVVMEIFDDILKIKGLELHDWEAIFELKKKYTDRR